MRGVNEGVNIYTRGSIDFSHTLSATQAHYDATPSTFPLGRGEGEPQPHSHLQCDAEFTSNNVYVGQPIPVHFPAPFLGHISYSCDDARSFLDKNKHIFVYTHD